MEKKNYMYLQAGQIHAEMLIEKKTESLIWKG
jgi:hypothetical protein